MASNESTSEIGEPQDAGENAKAGAENQGADPGADTPNDATTRARGGERLLQEPQPNPICTQCQCRRCRRREWVTTTLEAIGLRVLAAYACFTYRIQVANRDAVSDAARKAALVAARQLQVSVRPQLGVVRISPVRQDAFDGVRNRTMKLYLYGRADYMDVFGAPYCLTFCQFLDPITGTWAVANAYNGVRRGRCRQDQETKSE